MKIDTAKIDTGVMLVLEHNVWKGYNLNENNEWVDETELARFQNQCYPFCLTISENVIIKAFEACPSVENKMLIIRGVYGDYMDAFLLVGDKPEEHFLSGKFKTIESIDDSSRDWVEI
jgi:hypothetical protein